MRSLLTILTFLFTIQSLASAATQHGFSPQEYATMAEDNELEAATWSRDKVSLFANDNPLSLNLLRDTQARAYAEYQQAGYLIFSGHFDFNSKPAKMAMAANLPEDVQLVVFTELTDSDSINKLKKQFRPFISLERLHIVYIPNAVSGFWARDGVPVPVFRNQDKSSAEDLLSLVDARYYRFEQDKDFGKLFKAPVTSHPFAYEGGNFMANAKNECLIVNNPATAKIPHSVFLDQYGCEKLIRLPYVKGIGHADESVKFINDDTVLTDERTYVSILEENGYKVIQLPRPSRLYETYVNSLMVNGTVYVPVFSEPQDQVALKVYEDAGFKVVGVPSKVLSNEGLGSIHCITMTYPPVAMETLLETIGARPLAKH